MKNPVYGIMITIEHAAFLAENLGVSIPDDVIKALKESGFNNKTTKKVTIQSTNSSALTKFKQQTSYKLVYAVDESISNADQSALADIKKFADYVAVEKNSIFPKSQAFITSQTKLVSTLQSAGFMVFVYVLRNEFVSQPWDFFSDPTVQINSFYQGVGVDGIVTDYPATAVRYRKNSCMKLKEMPSYMAIVLPGALLGAIPPTDMPPALAPYPVLVPADVIEKPLPTGLKPTNSSPPSSQPSCSPASASLSIALVGMVLYASLVALLF